MKSHKIREGSTSGRRGYKAAIACAVIILLAGPPQVSKAAATPGGANWTAYISAQDEPVPWANTVRGIGRNAFTLDVVTTEKDKSEALDHLKTSVSVNNAAGSMIVPIGGIPNAARPEEFTAYKAWLARDAGASWSKFVKLQVKAIASAQPGKVIYLQVGNEVNSVKFIASLGDRGLLNALGLANDTSAIPAYVEQVLAPTVAGVRAALADDPALKGRIFVLSGTIANAFKPESREWLKQLLGYRIEGKFAPSLKGMHAGDVVDYVGIHYLISRDDQAWREDLGSLAGAIAHYRIKGLFLTEELGRKFPEDGLGEAVAYKVLVRYLSWVYANNYSPDYTRMNFWGWKMGPQGSTANDAMNNVFHHLGSSKLTPLKLNAQQGEIYGFKSVGSNSSLVVSVFAQATRIDEQLAISGGLTGSNASCSIVARDSDRGLNCTIKNGTLVINTPGAIPMNSVIVAFVK